MPATPACVTPDVPGCSLWGPGFRAALVCDTNLNTLPTPADLDFALNIQKSDFWTVVEKGTYGTVYGPQRNFHGDPLTGEVTFEIRFDQSANQVIYTATGNNGDQERHATTLPADHGVTEDCLHAVFLLAYPEDAYENIELSQTPSPTPEPGVTVTLLPFGGDGKWFSFETNAWTNVFGSLLNNGHTYGTWSIRLYRNSILIKDTCIKIFDANPSQDWPVHARLKSVPDQAAGNWEINDIIRPGGQLTDTCCGVAGHEDLLGPPNMC
jgi:hypothetical protein